MSGLLLWAVIVALVGWAGWREERRLGRFTDSTEGGDAQ